MTLSQSHVLPLGDAHSRLRELTLEHPLGLPLDIRFQVAALNCRARLEEKNGEIHAHLSACLGHLPFSSENETARRDVVDWVRHNRHQVPGRLYMDRHGRLWIDQPTILPQIPNASEFLVVLSQLLVILLPDVGDALENLIPHMLEPESDATEASAG